MALLHEDVVLYQPHLPPIRGKAEATQEFKKLLTWLPGLHGVIERASGDDEIVFIEWQLRLPVGKRTISIRAVDRFRLEDGLGTERAVYFDQLDLIKVVLAHPSLWLGYLKYRFGKYRFGA